MSATSTQADSATTEVGQTLNKSGFRPRRTLNRLALALAGILLAILGQMAFHQESLWEGLIFYALAIVLFTRTLAHHLDPAYSFSIVNPQLAKTLTMYRGWRRNIGIWLMLLAVGVSAMSYVFFDNEDALRQAWWLYLAALGMFAVGGVLLTPGTSLRKEARRLIPNRYAGIGLLSILGLALILRLFNFGEVPFGIWFDEAEAGLAARRILNDPNYQPVFYPAINVTGQFLTTYALALRWLGDDIGALRSVSVFFGVAGVVAAYLCGRELRGPRFGLTLAFLLAVARWPVNFSRIAMTGIDAPFFEFLSLFFIIRLVKFGRLRDALWAGLTLGFGLVYYAAFRLYVLALVLFILIVAVRWWPQLSAAMRHQGWRRYLVALAIVLAAGWLVIMPVVKFALDEPEAFWYRTRQISIITKRDEANLGQALWQSSYQHLLMFNFSGDKNGRHNLPGEPMLDPAMGILFVLGIGLALARRRNPANLFFLVLFFAALVGGIFSVDFEAPQALRSIAVVPAVIYFCGLTLVALGREAEQALRPLPKRWLFVPVAAVAGYILVFNAYTYFVRQANDFASWNAFSAPETLTGRKMAELGPAYVYVLSPFLANHPTIEFLAPEITEQEFLRVPDALPVRDPSGRPVAIFIHPDDAWIYEEAERLYPGAEFEVYAGPPNATEDMALPSVYFVGLQPPDLMALRGLDLRYWPDRNDPADVQPVAPPLSASRAFNINVTWPQDGPNAPEFVAEWDGVLYAPQYGAYGLRLRSPAQALLEIDGNVVLEGEAEQLTVIPLAQGNHRIRVRADSAPGQVALFWQPPGRGEELVPAWALYTAPITNHGLQASFYANGNWQGQPTLQRIDPFLDSYFHLIPFNRPYTVEWAGSLVVPRTGVYRLGLRVVQEAELYLDRRLILTSSGPNQHTEAAVTLEAGLHDLLVRYRDSVDRSRVHLTWIPPNGVFESIPSENLWPPMGSYPEPVTSVQEAGETRPFELYHLESIGSPGNQPGQFFEPRDIAVMSNGNVVVADTGNRRVQIFDPQFTHLKTLAGNEFPFEEPVAVGVNSQDEILVLDSTLQWIYRYDAAGNLLDRFGGPTAHLFHPRGLTVLDDDSLALADTGTSRILLFGPDGDPTGSIGSLGPGPGQLNEPTDIVRDVQGTYFVVEAENNRLQRLDAAGNPLAQWDIPLSFAYDGPHLDLGPDGSIFITESQSNSLLRYSSSGELINQWHTVGPINLADPVGIYFDRATNRLYVTDVGTHQVYVLWLQPISDDN